MDQPPTGRRVDIASVVRRLRALEAARRARRMIVVGLAMAPTSYIFAVTRFRPDFAWTPAEILIAAPLLLISGLLVLAGVLGLR